MLSSLLGYLKTIFIRNTISVGVALVNPNQIKINSVTNFPKESQHQSSMWGNCSMFHDRAPTN